ACNTHFSDEACTAEIEDLDAWKIGDGKIPATGTTPDPDQPGEGGGENPDPDQPGGEGGETPDPDQPGEGGGETPDLPAAGDDDIVNDEFAPAA
ncbi:MAG: hypothetical protein J6L87_01460, partial [Clostridia bacterium]|nr:hypothetical protein [Clostridia bacterium]